MALDEFIRVVTTPPAPLGRLFFVPPLPADFVVRPVIMQELKQAVLSSLPARAMATTVIVGMAGIGKTVLVTAFARDQEVRRAFPHGIFWLAVGKQDSILELQKKLLSMLGAFSDIRTEEEGRFRLMDRLADAQVLIILDDAMEPRLMKAFIGLSENCRTVITTRISIDLGGKQLFIDVPSPEESLTILAQSAGLSVDALPKEALAIARELGHHPLALKIAAAYFRNHDMSWREIHERLRGGWSPQANGQSTLKDALEASYAALSEHEQKLLVELALAFSEESTITISGVANLWAKSAGVNEQDARKILTKLNDMSLINLDEDHPGEPRIMMHGLISQFLRDVSEKRKG